MSRSDRALLKHIADLDGATDLQRVIAEARRSELHVVMAGDFNNGKSTLLNAMLGRRLLLSSAVPTTGQITRVRFGRKEQVIVRDTNGQEKIHPIDHLERVTTLDEAGSAAAEVDQVTVVCDAHLLQNSMVMGDTPGTNDDDPQTKRALAALGTADVIMWVIRADAALKKGERELADRWLAENPGALLIPVVNFMNLVSPRETPAVVQRLEALLNRMCGHRVAWVKSLTGRPYFQIDAQRALDWTAEGVGEPESDFTALLDFLGRLRGKRAANLVALSRRGWVGTRMERVRYSNGEQLDRLKAAAMAACESRKARRRERESQLRHFKARAEACFAVIENEGQKKLAERRECLLDNWLSNQSVSSLREKTDGWGRDRLEEAAKTIVECANISRKALAAEFGVPAGCEDMTADSLPLGFSVSLPSTSLADDFWNLVGATPTADFMSKARSVVRGQWEDRAKLVLDTAETVWGRWTKWMRTALENRFSIESAPGTEGWLWEVTDELIEIKAREVRMLRRDEIPKPLSVSSKVVRFFKRLIGMREPLRPSQDYDERDWKQAKQLLKHRVKSGEPLQAEVLKREAAATALEELSARHVGADV